ncbi:unnamed protein product, partial [Phaeothamnion confervicola]
MNFKVLGFIAAFVGYAACAGNAAANIIYHLDIGPSAVGTITTDGTSGTLQTSNIVDFNITLTTIGSTTVTGPLSGGNYILLGTSGVSTSVGSTPGGFTATPTSLSFDTIYSSYFIFLSDGGYLCFNGPGGGCDGHPYSVSILLT